MVNFYNSKSFCIWIFVLSIFYLLRVFYQIITANERKELFKSLWNNLDIVGSITIMFYIFHFVHDHDLKNYKFYNFWLLISAFCLLIRGVQNLATFSSNLRLLVGVIIQTFKDISAFLFLFFYMISAMSVMHLVVARGEDEYQEKVDKTGMTHSMR